MGNYLMKRQRGMRGMNFEGNKNEVKRPGKLDDEEEEKVNVSQNRPSFSKMSMAVKIGIRSSKFSQKNIQNCQQKNNKVTKASKEKKAKALVLIENKVKLSKLEEFNLDRTLQAPNIKKRKPVIEFGSNIKDQTENPMVGLNSFYFKSYRTNKMKKQNFVELSPSNFQSLRSNLVERQHFKREDNNKLDG